MLQSPTIFQGPDIDALNFFEHPYVDAHPDCFFQFLNIRECAPGAFFLFFEHPWDAHISWDAFIFYEHLISDEDNICSQIFKHLHPVPAKFTKSGIGRRKNRPMRIRGDAEGGSWYICIYIYIYTSESTWVVDAMSSLVHTHFLIIWVRKQRGCTRTLIIFFWLTATDYVTRTE